MKSKSPVLAAAVLAGIVVFVTAFVLLQSPATTAQAQIDAAPVASPVAAPDVGPSAPSTATVSSRLSTIGHPVAAVQVAGSAITVVLALPESVLYNPNSLPDSDALNLQVIRSLDGLPYTIFHVLTIDPRNPTAAPKPVNAFVPERPRENKPISAQPDSANLPAPRNATELHYKSYFPIWAGSSSSPPVAPITFELQGKAVYLSAGHGWYYNPIYGWLTQRGAWYGLIEDHNNAEAVDQYLIPYLRQAGADVFPTRDPSLNPAEVRIDNTTAGGYVETGNWFDGQAAGGYGGAYRATTSSEFANASASATWRAAVPQSGWYPVYAWYVPATNRAPDVHYRITHAGGTAEVVIDQRVHGYTWRYLGSYYFRAGETAEVQVLNISTVAGAAIVADAIRLGGGTGDVDRGGGTSGKPRFEEGARYWAMLMGAPASVFDPVPDDYAPCGALAPDACDDVTARPRYADWENAGSGDDAVFVSWHTNGANGTARGTESYVYNNDPEPPYDQYKRVDGSLELQAAVHDKVIQAIRSGWDATWTDRGKLQANLGEVRVAQSMPSMLIEMAFHDNADDTNQLREPRFEQLLARAAYQGIVDYFARKAGKTPHYLPEPPQRLVMRNNGAGGLVLSWQAPATYAFGLSTDPARYYRVYLSADGFAWDGGRDVSGTIAVIGGYAAGQVVYARVNAVNDGGESFPTPVLAARVGSGSSNPAALLVQGFDSLTAAQLIPHSGADRMWLDSMNRLNYIALHADAVTLPFDSAVHQAVDAGDVALTAYSFVDWFSGRQAAGLGVLSANERAALRGFVAAGRVLLLSGTEISTYLSVTDPDFADNVLRSAAITNRSTSRVVNAPAGGIFAALESGSTFYLDDGSHGAYDAGAGAALAPVNGAAAVLLYGDGAVAASAYAPANGGQVVYLGFPFETVYPAGARLALMDRILRLVPSLGPCVEPVANGGFEGDGGWQINPTPYPAAYLAGLAHSGARSMQTGIPLSEPSPVAAFSSVSQTIVVPAVAAPVLTVWRSSLSQDTQDNFYVSVWGHGYLDRTTIASNGWQKLTFDLSAYRGQQIVLLLGTYNNGDGLRSVAYYDDVSVGCGP